ncbi:hypothetical protein [Halomarina oriensis]|uniref:Uncharacterized protein n=1 Tax=Halomarina oriensis TaxID=671145 RepID=A0A6B0GWT5_9EURY|nr:hypothetical protein [Halomarina oriensis]MWG36605.1 hypothetical protein [Halomarina oriensis]
MDHDELITTLHRLEDRIDTLEDENRRLRDAYTELREQVTDDVGRRVTALGKKTAANQTRIAELQSRELEKGAHLDAEHVYEPSLVVDGGRVERFEKDDGTYVRLPGRQDALTRGGTTTLAHADLLPVQQLTRLDDDMLASEPRPVRLAVDVWRDRLDDQAAPRLWQRGSGRVHQYLDAGELATWIRVEERGVSKSYAQKLASRTIDALLELTNGRTYDELRNHRKDGLRYKERRLVLPADASIPGERRAPQTAAVDGE